MRDSQVHIVRGQNKKKLIGDDLNGHYEQENDTQ